MADILLVEDSRVQALAYRQLLEAAGHSVRHAATPEEALQLCVEATPALVILDQHLKDRSGLEVCRRLKGDLNHQLVPILMLTGSQKERDHIAALDAGADRFLSKESPDEQLLALVEGLLRSSVPVAALDGDAGRDSFLRDGRLLAVDDSRTYLTELVQKLTESGFRVTPCLSGAEALALLEGGEFHAVIADVVMPEMDGFEVCRRARRWAVASGRPLGLLILSGQENRKVLLQSLEAGADDFVSKAQDMDVILAHVQSLVRRVGMMRHIQAIGRRSQEQAQALRESEWRHAQADERAKAAEARAELNDELRRAKEVAEAGERRVRLIVEAAHDAFVSIDDAGRITDWNPQAEATFGWPREEAMGRDLAETIIPPAHRAAHEGGLRHFLATGEGPVLNKRIELPALRRDGHEFPVEVTIVPIRVGQSYAFCAFLHDITERKRAERDLRQARDAAESANRSKSEFLANMSHEIRTPMNGILGMADLLLNTALSPQQREFLGILQQSAGSLLGLLNDILDFSKIEAGKLHLEAIEFDLAEVVGSTAQTLGVRAAAKGLELACDIAPDVPALVVGDPARLQQILVNLAGNAIKFTDKGEVVISVRLESRADGIGTFRLAVRDTGIGIPADKHRTIFELFSQADSSTSRRFGGTGLGLNISSQLAALMGGRVWVESEPGKGSTFHVLVRLGVPDQAAKRAAVPVDLDDLPVLIVDDNETNRRILVEMLRGWRMRPTETDGGAAALAELSRTPYPLVLLDYLMPGMDGMDFAARMRAEPANRDSKVLMLSSATPADATERCRELGIARLMTKPVKRSDLLDAIVTVMGVQPPGSPAAAPSFVERPAGVPAMTILLAEDNAVNQMVAVGFLERRGHRVVVAVDGKQAVEALERERFDLVLMDMHMPEMDGIEATRAIRERERREGGHVPIVAMTASAMQVDQERCLEAGMDGYLSKPVRASELYRVVEGVRTPAVPPAAEAEGVVDWAVASEQVQGNEQLLGELAELFLSLCPGMMDAIRQAIARGETKVLHRAAHTLRGAAGSVGARRVAAKAERLESMGARGDLTDAAPAWAELEREAALLTAALTGRLGGNKPP